MQKNQFWHQSDACFQQKLLPCCPDPTAGPLSSNWPLIRHLPARILSSLVAGCCREELPAVTPPCQQLCFWEPPRTSRVGVFCPDGAGWAWETRHEREEASSWGHILAQIRHHGAELIDGPHWQVSHPFMHRDWEPSGCEHWAGVCPVVAPGYRREGEAKRLLAYGKMESGAEASPQHLPRRKAVLHSLEDQKRVSSWPTPVWVNLPSCWLHTIFTGNLVKLNCCSLMRAASRTRVCSELILLLNPSSWVVNTVIKGLLMLTADWLLCLGCCCLKSWWFFWRCGGFTAMKMFMLPHLLLQRRSRQLI